MTILAGLQLVPIFFMVSWYSILMPMYSWYRFIPSVLSRTTINIDFWHQILWTSAHHSGQFLKDQAIIWVLHFLLSQVSGSSAVLQIPFYFDYIALYSKIYQSLYASVGLRPILTRERQSSLGEGRWKQSKFLSWKKTCLYFELGYSVTIVFYLLLFKQTYISSCAENKLLEP